MYRDDQPTESSAVTVGVTGLREQLTQLYLRERLFLVLLGLTFLVAGMTYEIPQVAMWVGFAVAGYAATTNDSIQTLGTFLASNAHRPWWQLWLFMAAILVATLAYSWWAYDGDISYQRLASKGFSQAPTSFSFLQIAAPIFLIILTRLRMPVSTTFLCLSGFAATGSSLGAVVMKSVVGYGVAFVVAIIVWYVVERFVAPRFRSRAPHRSWVPVQWAVSGALWSVWLMQDAANIAVFLPRQLSLTQLVPVLLILVFGLALLFFLRGDRIQQVVTEKSDVTDVRSATIVDFVYAALLWYFKGVSNIPMSTTWVFVGLLAGRELAMAVGRETTRRRGVVKAVKLIAKDLLFVTIGLIVSLAIAASVNPGVHQALFDWLP